DESLFQGLFAAVDVAARSAVAAGGTIVIVEALAGANQRVVDAWLAGHADDLEADTEVGADSFQGVHVAGEHRLRLELLLLEDRGEDGGGAEAVLDRDADLPFDGGGLRGPGADLDAAGGGSETGHC